MKGVLSFKALIYYKASIHDPCHAIDCFSRPICYQHCYFEQLIGLTTSKLRHQLPFGISCAFCLVSCAFVYGEAKFSGIIVMSSRWILIEKLLANSNRRGIALKSVASGKFSVGAGWRHTVNYIVCHIMNIN